MNINHLVVWQVVYKRFQETQNFIRFSAGDTYLSFSSLMKKRFYKFPFTGRLLKTKKQQQQQKPVNNIRTNLQFASEHTAKEHKDGDV